jgi:phosphotransferase system HPr (HPr) family protein
MNPAQSDDSGPLVADVLVVNPQGLHARPISEFVRVACRYRASVVVRGPGGEVDGCSVLDMMRLQGAHGSSLQIQTSGEDAQLALDALCSLVSSGFGEL